jgi:hypothetical protein
MKQNCKCGYIVDKSKIVNENDRTAICKFKWNDEFICQRKMKGGDPRGHNGTSDENSYDSAEEEEEGQEEEFEDMDEDFDINFEEMIWVDNDNWVCRCQKADIKNIIVGKMIRKKYMENIGKTS